MAVKLPKKQTYDPNSVVGITNYTDSSSQNDRLRNLVRDGQATEVALADAGVTTGKTVKTGSTANTGKSNIGKQGDGNIGKQGDGKGGTGASDGDNVWNAINTPFTASNAYMEAMNYTNGLLQQLSSGRTSYTDQIKDLMAQIQGREDFSYDVSQDTLFQQSLASAMASGKTAMQDTIGQASALTGGYGSTYATSAGNQAYNGYIQDAYANLPEYYQMALDAYEAEGQRMYDQLGMLTNADATEYQRMYDAWNANYNNAQNMYAQEYGLYQDDIANSMNMAKLQMQREAHDADLDYQQRQLQMKEEAHKADMEYQQWKEAIEKEKANTPWDYQEVTSTIYDKWSREGIESAMAYLDSLNIPENHEFALAVEEYMAKNIGFVNPDVPDEEKEWNAGGFDEKSVPMAKRTFTISDTSWGKPSKVKDNFGIEHDVDDLPMEWQEQLKGKAVGDKFKFN